MYVLYLENARASSLKCSRWPLSDSLLALQFNEIDNESFFQQGIFSLLWTRSLC